MTSEPRCEPKDENSLYPVFKESIKAYHGNRNDLIMALHKAQSLFGYLPKSALELISEKLNVSIHEVYGVASFYSFFSMVPKGRHEIKVCLGTACYVRGGQKIIEKLSKDLDVKVGQTTKDRKFSLNEVRCVGACSLASVVLVNDDVYAKVETHNLENILNTYE